MPVFKAIEYRDVKPTGRTEFYVAKYLGEAVDSCIKVHELKEGGVWVAGTSGRSVVHTGSTVTFIIEEDPT